MRVIGLPGNPVSSYVCGFLFLVPLIRALSGRDSIHHVRETRPARPRSRRQRPARRLSSRAPRDARGRHADRGAGQPSGLVAAWKSRCGTGTCDTSAVRAGGRKGLALARSCGCRNDALSGACRTKPQCVHLKLSGCGTHIEHIVSVHDLFRGLVSMVGSFGNSRDATLTNSRTERRRQPGECSRCLRANSMNFCVSSMNG